MLEGVHPASAPPFSNPSGSRLLNSRLRPLRFAFVGSVAGLLQLSLLAFLMNLRVDALPANVAAFLVAAQLNFALSSLFTWGDRRAPKQTIPIRWAAFHAWITGTALLNVAVFAIVRAFVPVLAASALGIAAAALANFLLGDRFVFRGMKAAGGLRRAG